VAPDYAAVTAPFFESYAVVALERAGVTAASRVLDVACGPGTLSLLAARRGCRVTAVDFAAAMIDELRSRMKSTGLAIEAQVADGQSLPFEAAQFDAAFSMFGLMFFPDRARGLRQMHRVLVPGGVACIATWQPMDRFALLTDVFAALRELLPGMPLGEGKAPLGEPSEIIAEMTAAGFGGVKVEAVSASYQAATVEAAWTWLYRGSAPFALLHRQIGEAAWQKVERGLIETLRGKYGPGPQTMTMVANLAIGRV
jgi:SAM-dependent methyltransferase